MRNYIFRIIIEPDEPKGYHGFVPLLKGIHTCGDTIDEVRKNLNEAIKCHIQGLVKSRQAIPREEEVLELVQAFSQKEFALNK